jgi:hypothetical protein
VQQIVPDSMAWIGHACDWELNRHACVDFPLQSPDAAIPPEKQTISLAAAMSLRARFQRQGITNTCAVVALFDANDPSPEPRRALALKTKWRAAHLVQITE